MYSIDIIVLLKLNTYSILLASSLPNLSSYSVLDTHKDKFTSSTFWWARVMQTCTLTTSDFHYIYILSLQLST